MAEDEQVSAYEDDGAVPLTAAQTNGWRGWYGTLDGMRQGDHLGLDDEGRSR